MHFIHSPKDCPSHDCGSFYPEQRFSHKSVSPASSSVTPRLVMLRLQPSIHLSLGLPVLRVPSGFHSRVLHCSQFPGIPFTCLNDRNRSFSVTANTIYSSLHPYLSYDVISKIFSSRLPCGCSPKIHPIFKQFMYLLFTYLTSFEYRC